MYAQLQNGLERYSIIIVASFQTYFYHHSSTIFSHQVRQWLQMPFTLHLISTVLGLISFLPIAMLLYLSYIGLYKLLKPRSKPPRYVLSLRFE